MEKMRDDYSDRLPSYATGPLPFEALSPNERNMLKGINSLLEKILKLPSSASGNRASSENSIWANPKRRKNNVILINGARGTGKTSLLMTFLKGLNCPETGKCRNRGADCDCKELGFQDTQREVRALPPIDFDPYPPKLPVYNWIIQAFYPLVRMLDEEKTKLFQNNSTWGSEEPQTLMEKFRKVDNSAAVGWNTGLLKNALGKDVDEYLLWQEEQQRYWQKLAKEWQDFLGALMEGLECHGGGQGLPCPRLIILPIDDLDLQVERVGELLRALRLLRHDRLVYLLTGDTENTDLALTTSYQRDFARGVSALSEDSLDKIAEYSAKLGLSLREKTIPHAQTFLLHKLTVKQAMEWCPIDHFASGTNNHADRSRTLAALLNKLWNGSGDNKRELGSFLNSRPPELDEEPALSFRDLQNFYDKWAHASSGKPLQGISEFCKIAIEDPSEERLFVSAPSTDSRIYITGEPGIVVICPFADIQFTDIPGITIKHAIGQMYFQVGQNWTRPSFRERNQASPNHLRALDLAEWDANTFRIDPQIGLAQRSLGFVWTEDAIRNVIIPWPMPNLPRGPSKWVKRFRQWKSALKIHENGENSSSAEGLLMAWCDFVVANDKKNEEKKKVAAMLSPGECCHESLKDHVKRLRGSRSGRLVADLLSREDFGLSPEIRKILERDNPSELVDSSIANLSRKASGDLDRMDYISIAFDAAFGEPAPPNT